jgi:tetratricopeptide repeat protein 30
LSADSTQGNYEFGVSRVIKSLEPYSAKLSTDTWFYAKRCLLSLVDGLAKHMIPFKSEAWEEVLAFLEEAEAVGHSIPASFSEAGGAGGGGAAAAAGGGARGSEGATVASEARLLRALLLKMRQMH